MDFMTCSKIKIKAKHTAGTRGFELAGKFLVIVPGSGLNRTYEVGLSPCRLYASLARIYSSYEGVKPKSGILNICKGVKVVSFK